MNIELSQSHIRHAVATRSLLLALAGMLALGSMVLAQGGVWLQRKDMPVKALTTTSVVGGKVYVIGGTQDQINGPVLSTVYEYDPVVDTWTRKADLPEPRCNHAACVVDNRIYVLGGEKAPSYFEQTGALLIYDPSTDTWTRGADMPTARAWVAAGAVGGRIYAAGGSATPGGWLGTNIVEAYDPGTDTWTRVADLPAKRYGHASAVAQGVLYVLGGFVDAYGDIHGLGREVYGYDPATDTWSVKTKLPRSVSDSWFMSATTLDGQIYVLGGRGGGAPMDNADAYDPATDTWTQLAPMPTPASLGPSSTCAVDGMLLAIGGMPPLLASAGTVQLYLPDRSYLLESGTRSLPPVVVGRPAKLPVEVTLKEPLSDGTFPPMEVDLSLAGQPRTVALTDEGSGRYAGELGFDPRVNGQFPLPVRMVTPGAEPLCVYSISLQVWPAADLALFADGPGTGWVWQKETGATLDTAATASAYQGVKALGVKASAAWKVSCQADAPVNRFGYQTLRVALHPGDATATVLEVGVNAHRRTNLLKKVDWRSQAWQVVEIPTDSLQLDPQETIATVMFSGLTKGTFYLDEVALVAEPAPQPPTAVLESCSAPLPKAFALRQNYPNPFNSETMIGFDLPRAGEVDLALYDLLGQRVATLAQGQRSAGTYTVQWDGRDDVGQALASGVYLYRLQSAHQTETRKLLLLR